MEPLILISIALLVSVISQIVMLVLYVRMRFSLERAKKIIAKTVGQQTILKNTMDSPEGKALRYVSAAQKNKSLKGKEKRGYVFRQLKRQFPKLSEKAIDKLIAKSLILVKAYGD